MRLQALLTLVLLTSACSSTTTLEVTDTSNRTVFTDGPLRVTATDTISMMGALFARPSATGGPGQINVRSTRYGSLCQYAVSGRADVTSSSITLHVTFSERLTSCIAQVRSLTYDAELTGLPAKTYDLTVVHEESGRKDTVLVSPVAVR